MDWGNINPKQGDETGRGGPNDERDDSRSPRDDSDSKTKGAVVWGSPRSEEGWNTRKLSEDPILNPEKSSSSKPCNWGMGHHTEGWGNSGVSGGWGHSGPRDKGQGGRGTFKGRPSRELGSTSCRRYPNINYGRFPTRPRKVFGNTDKGNFLGKRTCQGENSGSVTTSAFQRTVKLTFLFGMSTNHTSTVGSWQRGTLKSELINLRPSLVYINTLTSDLMLNNSLRSITLLYLESQFGRFFSKHYSLRLYGSFKTSLTPFKQVDEVYFPAIFDLTSLCITDRSGRNVFSAAQRLPILLWLNNENFSP